MVVGDRNVMTIEHFSPTKKRAAAARQLGRAPGVGHDVPDATSGFRAYNREAALGLTVVSKFTYTLESLIQAGKSLVAVDARAGATNPRPASRGCSGRCGATCAATCCAMFRIYTGYEPLLVFSPLAASCSSPALAAWTPFLWDWLVHGDRTGHLQSIVLGGVLLLASVQVFALGVLADLIAAHRMVSQRTLERVRRIELELGVEPSHYEPGGSDPDERRAELVVVDV